MEELLDKNIINSYKNIANKNKIPSHRLEYIDKRVNDFILEFKILHFPLDMLKLLIKIEKNQNLPITIKSLNNLDHTVDAVTVYYSKYNCYFIIINKSKITYPFKTSSDKKLNFTLAHELAHIYLNHYELPEYCKTENDLLIEEFEADEFATRINNLKIPK